MKVILLEESRVAEVSRGYARNFLFPKKLAVLATPVNIGKFEKKLKEKEAEIALLKKEALELADKLSLVTVVVKAEAGEEGKLFGSITAQDVKDAVASQLNVEIDKRKINLNEQIKALGEYSASIKLRHEVVAHLKIMVEKP